MHEDVERLDRTVEQVLAAARAEERGAARRAERARLSPRCSRACVEEIRQRHGLPDDAVRLDAADAGRRVGDAAPSSRWCSATCSRTRCKYSDAPVEVRVRVAAARASGRVRVEIADRGIGIPRRELRKIFQRFYRAGRDVQRPAAGLGLGLFIVRNLVRRQGGARGRAQRGPGPGQPLRR